MPLNALSGVLVVTGTVTNNYTGNTIDARMEAIGTTQLLPNAMEDRYSLYSGAITRVMTGAPTLETSPRVSGYVDIVSGS